MAERDDEEGFLARWSRRKRQQDHAERDSEAARVSGDAASGGHASEAAEFEADALPQRILERPEAELTETEREWLENRRQAEAVDLETVAYESDFTIFLKRGVPKSLRQKALRKLWASNPVLANLDGLNDYEEHFADPALNTFNSAWQVGRGYPTSDDRTEESAAGDADSTAPEDEADERTADAENQPTEAPANPTNEDVSGTRSDEPVSDGTVGEPEGEPALHRVSLRRRLGFDNP